jgi:membrane protease YdiL (CAAX protease family)
MSSTDFERSNALVDEIVLGDRALAAWEITSVVSSALIAEWILSAAAGRTKAIIAIPTSLAFFLIVSSQRLRRENHRELGFRLDNFLQALKLLLVPMVLVAVLTFVIGWIFGARPDFLRWHAERRLAAQLGLGTAWGFLQQYVLQSFLNRRTQTVWGSGAISVLVTAAIFAGLHFPNPWLMVVTFVGGLIWANVFQRAPNLFALALSHSVMTWILVSTLPASALNHLRIGFKYFG